MIVSCAALGRRHFITFFLDCSFSALIWQNSPLQSDLRERDSQDLIGWLEQILLGGDCHKIELLFMIMWNLWNERNTVVWTAKRRSPCEVVDGAVRLFYEFEEHQPTPSMSISRAKAKWQKPPLSAVKINVDGAFQVQTGIRGGGLLLVILLDALWLHVHASSAIFLPRNMLKLSPPRGPPLCQRLWPGS